MRPRGCHGDPKVSSLVHDVVERAMLDDGVVGVVLSGSQARAGMATEHSDADVYVVVERAAADRWTTRRSAELDLIVCTVEDLRIVAGPGDPDRWWNRYSFAHAQVLLDKLDRQVTSLVRTQGRLNTDEASALARSSLDAYVNWAYRSVKNHRDGRLLESRLDAAESLPAALTCVFAQQQRIRPYNKYLRWELEHHPLRGDCWQPSALLPLLDRILRDGDVSAQREMFACVERSARESRHGDVLEVWGDELAVLR